MGVIKQGILGGFLGKVGGVIGGNFKGISTMRAMPLSVANPRTSAQVNNRVRFSNVTAFAQLIGLSFIQTHFNRMAVKMSGYNLFTSLNANAWSELGVFDSTLVVMSPGSMVPPVLSAVVADESLATIVGTITYPLTGEHLATDLINIIAVNGNGLEAVVSIDILPSVGTFSLPLFAGSGSGADVTVYAVSRRADGTKLSSSIYEQIVVQP